MKISTNNSYGNSTYYLKTNFKSVNTSPYIKKELVNISKNPVSKDFFIKLAGILGLTTIISWVNSLKENNDGTILEKLNSINETWNKKAQEKLINAETSGAYIDLLSKSDSTEAVLWTEALLDKDNTILSTTVKAVPEAAQKLFLEKDSNETFMNISANKKFNNIINQIGYMLTAEKSSQESFLENIKSKLNSLIKEADLLENNEETSSIYQKFSNIIKTFTLLKLLEFEEKSDLKKQNEENIAEDIVNKKLIKEGAGENNDTVRNNQVKIVGKVDLKTDGISRFKPNNENETKKDIVKDIIKKEFIVTDENKDFIELFKKSFKKNSLVVPEIYADKIDFIMNLYNNYKSDNLRKSFLKSLSSENLAKTLEKYQELTEGKLVGIDFLVFIHMQKLKHKSLKEFTKEEFDRLCDYKDVKVKYFTVQDVPEEITITFMPDISAEERFKIITDFHKIFFNIQENRLFTTNSDNKNITVNDIIKELSEKISKYPDDYQNIIKYLGIDTTLINKEALKGNEEGVYDSLEILFYEKDAKSRIQDLINILQNKAFDELFSCLHGKMRFIERFILTNPKNLNKSGYELKQIISKEILKLKITIEKSKDTILYNYKTNLNDYKNSKCSASLLIKNFVIALNKNSQIHTIFIKDDVYKPNFG